MQAVIDYLDELIAQSARSPLLDRVGRRPDDLWIPLRIVDAADPRQQPRGLDALEPGLRLVTLWGDPGSGKSVWLRHLASNIARASREQLERGISPYDVALPVLLHAREFADALADRAGLVRLLDRVGVAPPEDVIRGSAQRTGAALLAATVRRHRHLPPLADLLWERLTATDGPNPLVTIALDAWDECSSSERSLLEEHLRRYAEASNTRIFVASRILEDGGKPAFDSRPAAGGVDWRALRLLPIEPAEVEHFIDHFFTGDMSGMAAIIIDALRS